MKMTGDFLSGDDARAPVMSARTVKGFQAAAPFRPVTKRVRV